MNSNGFIFGKFFSPFRLLGRVMRVFLLFLILLFFAFWGRLFFNWLFPPSPPVSEQSFQQIILNILLYFLASGLIFGNAFYAAARYVGDIYEINFKDALRYLVMMFFGLGIPKVKVVGGQPVFSGSFDSLKQIGGPGILNIDRDNVVVIETLTAYKNVLMAGAHDLTRFDSIKEILSTEEQYEKIENIEALTADGIRVGIKEIQIRFRIHGFSPPNATGLPSVAYLPSKTAVKDLAYQRNVPADRKLAPWTGAVKGVVSGIVREHINNAYLGDLISPREVGAHPLDELRRKLESESTKERLKKMGVAFNSCHIGEVCVPDVDVDREHLQIWFAKKNGAIRVIRAQSKSESFASQERGRAEGQNMLLQAIVRALQEIGVDSKDPAAIRKNLRNILLTRTAQILESRTSIYKTNHKDSFDDNHKENGEHDAKEKL